MALDIKGLKRVFILKKGNGTLTLEDPDSRMSLSEVTGLLFHKLSGTDHGNPARAGTRRGPRGIPVQNHHRNERISHGKENKP